VKVGKWERRGNRKFRVEGGPREDMRLKRRGKGKVWCSKESQERNKRLRTYLRWGRKEVQRIQT
jgi:hypothetical protein